MGEACDCFHHNCQYNRWYIFYYFVHSSSVHGTWTFSMFTLDDSFRKDHKVVQGLRRVNSTRFAAQNNPPAMPLLLLDHWWYCLALPSFCCSISPKGRSWRSLSPLDNLIASLLALFYLLLTASRGVQILGRALWMLVVLHSRTISLRLFIVFHW